MSIALMGPSGFNPVLLWKIKPTYDQYGQLTAFGAQSITIPGLTAYKWIIIQCYWTNNKSAGFYLNAQKNHLFLNVNGSYALSGFNVTFTHRNFTIADDVITFDNTRIIDNYGSDASRSINNYRMIPVAIYGLK